MSFDLVGDRRRSAKRSWALASEVYYWGFNIGGDHYVAGSVQKVADSFCLSGGRCLAVITCAVWQGSGHVFGDGGQFHVRACEHHGDFARRRPGGGGPELSARRVSQRLSYARDLRSADREDLQP